MNHCEKCGNDYLSPFTVSKFNFLPDGRHGGGGGGGSHHGS